MVSEPNRFGRRVAPWLCALFVLAWNLRAQAFKEEGHRSIEAAAYQQLIDTNNSEVLVRLMKAGMLLGRLPAVPADGLTTHRRRHRRSTFAPVEAGKEHVDGVWLGSHLPDHSYEHQFESFGQCYHFMARSHDVVARPRKFTNPGNPGQPGSMLDEVPTRLSVDAYTRCMNLIEILFRGIVFDPVGARERHADVYTLIHIIEDSFSEAHASRTVDWKVAYLKPWRLRSWSTYAFFPMGWRYHVTESHHGVGEPRDDSYLTKACEDNKGKVVVPGCLSARALKAADAVAELLILLAKYADCHEKAGDGRRVCPGIDADWDKYKQVYFSHVDPDVSFAEGARPKPNMFRSDMVGPSNALERVEPASLGLGIAADFAEATKSLWLTADVFTTRDPVEQHKLSIADFVTYNFQLRLPIEMGDGQRPGGVAAELGARLPFDFLSFLTTAAQKYVSLYIGVRARAALIAGKVGGETRLIRQLGFAGVAFDLILFRHIWLGAEGPRMVATWDSLGPDLKPRDTNYWTIKAGVALNAL